MKSLANFNNKMKQLSPFMFVITITICTYLILIPFSLVEYSCQIPTTKTISQASFLGKIILASIIGPLIETLIFQHLIIEIIYKIPKIKNTNFIAIIISSLSFALTHSYNITYIIYTFIIGLLLAYAFVIYREKSFSSFWIVTLIHSLRNTITTLLIALNLI